VLAIKNFASINARFVLSSPEPLVGPGNFTTINIGGFDPHDATLEYGSCPFNELDLFNPDKQAVVLAGEFGRRGRTITSNPTYRAIFDALAVEDVNGAALGGTAIDAGDLMGAHTQHELRVKAAVLAFGNFIGSVVSHEAVHAIDPTLAHQENTLFQAGGATFEQKTGIVAFDANNFQPTTQDPLGFSPFLRSKLADRLPMR